MIKNMKLSTSIDPSGTPIFSASTELAFQKLNLPPRLSLDAAAKATVQLTISNPIAYTYDQAMHGLTVGVYEGFFKDSLLREYLQQTDAEKEMAELAQLIKNDQLTQGQRTAAVEKLKVSYEDLTNKKIDFDHIENLIDFLANPTNLFSGRTVYGDEQVRPTALCAVEDLEIIDLLSCFVEQFTVFFSTLNPRPTTFAKINELNPAAWKRFKQITPHEYLLSPSWANIFSELPNINKEPVFLDEVKKMQISNKGFKSWYKKMLNGDWVNV